MKSKFFLYLGLLGLPALAFAQQFDSFKSLVGGALNVVYYLMQSIFAVFSLGIIYTVFKYIVALNHGDAKTAGDMRQRLIWAIVAMAVLFSIWGIIYMLTQTLGWTNVGIPTLSPPK